MMSLKLFQKGDPVNVLCLGAHSDDIEIGCGGTILKLISDHKDVVFNWVVFSASEKRRSEARTSAAAFLAGAKRRTVTIKEFKDGYFPYFGGEIKDCFEALKRKVDPDLVFTHQRSDLHQDHRLVSELTWNTFRDHFILEYEIPKYDGDLGAPNVFVHLDEAVCATKIRHILRHFRTQAENHWFTDDTFRALMTLRGVESNAPSRFAEAFYGRKLLVG